MTDVSPPRTVAELRTLLAGLDGALLVLVDGYESGLSPIFSTDIQLVQQLAGRPDYLGRFDLAPTDATESVEAQLYGQRPKKVGAARPALILRRETARPN